MTSLMMVVPSRGRPRNVADLLESCMNITTCETRMTVVVDGDDPRLPEYQVLPYGGFADLVTLDGSPRKLGAILNCVMPHRARAYPYVGFMGDDHRPRTKGWDDALIQALDRPGVAYGNDLFQGASLPTACAVSSELVLALGYFCPPGLVHLFLDNFWALLGNTAGNLAYLDQVIIEHMHPAHPRGAKADWDAGYEFTMSREAMDADRARYEEFLAGRWQQDKSRVEAFRGRQ